MYRNYQEYLASPQWAEIKQQYSEHEQTDHCVLCSGVFTDSEKPNHHHFKYPKDWRNDSYENLILLCERCHGLVHEMADHGSDDITLEEYLEKFHNLRKAFSAIYNVCMKISTKKPIEHKPGKSFKVVDCG